jgi:POT family proton-dependent oligopeptide transporter
VLWIWRRQASRHREPHDIAKISIGATIAAVSNLVLVAAIFRSSGAPIHPIWPVLYSASLGVSFMYYWPTLLALVSRVTPPRVNATMIGIALMSLFVANTLIGWIGGFYERMSPIQFWTLHAAISALGAVLLTLFSRRLIVLHGKI